jgi:ankyrin repeat protein
LEDDDGRARVLYAVDDEGWSPLHMAARYGKMECMVLLLRHAPCNVNAKKDYGWTPLLLATFAGHANVTTYLVAVGRADPKVENDEGVDAFIQVTIYKTFTTCRTCLLPM